MCTQRCINMGVYYRMCYFGFLLLYLLLSDVISDSCDQHTRCSDCIRDSSVCVWCAAANFNGSRCKSANNPSAWCPELQNPRVHAEPFDIKNFSSNLGNVIQIMPQNIKIDLRPGVAVNFSFSYQPVSDYPVDLYFLFDTSETMKDVHDIIQNQTEDIYVAMQKLTQQLKIGMGSFIDKNTFPITDKINSKRTYSFRHHLPLQSNISNFKNVINQTEFGSNYDEPEGGLDALAQVMKCSQIGWGAESRKLIVFLTDGPYHFAGDGLVAGIFKPYDGKCYLNDNVYEKELEMDYPSVSMINKLASTEEIAIIFAVKSDVQRAYSMLSENISGSRQVTFGEKNSRDIVNILKEIYENISRKVKLKVNFRSGYHNLFEINFYPDCKENDEDNDQCFMKSNEIKNITGTIKLLKYVKTDSTTVDVVIEGIKEKLSLNVNFINDCPCESKSESNSTKCNHGGTLKCGICECFDNRYGANCACKKNSMSRTTDNSTCIMQGDSKECSGHGSCICGDCVCRDNSPYEGKFCEFNKDNCPRHNNVVCSDHGRCEYEKCICNDGWSGPACECIKANATCIGVDGRVCNGMGACVCGKCACAPTAEWDARDNRDAFCSIRPCQDCHIPQCDLLNKCALCLHSGLECSECQHIEASLSKYLILPTENVTWNVCPDLNTKLGCYTRYMYKYSQNEYRIELVVQTHEDCLESYYKFGGISVAVLILVGIICAVAWKLVTNARDRREYERFLKQHAEDLATVCDNPCYQSPSTTINNPTFRKPSVDLTKC